MKREYIRKKRVALEGEMNFHETIITPPRFPAVAYPRNLTYTEKEHVITEAIRKGFRLHAKVIRPHHTALEAKYMPSLVGTIVGFTREQRGVTYGPIQVEWGRPNTGPKTSFCYAVNDLELIDYSWENK